MNEDTTTVTLPFSQYEKFKEQEKLFEDSKKCADLLRIEYRDHYSISYEGKDEYIKKIVEENQHLRHHFDEEIYSAIGRLHETLLKLSRRERRHFSRTGEL